MVKRTFVLLRDKALTFEIIPPTGKGKRKATGSKKWKANILGEMMFKKDFWGHKTACYMQSIEKIPPKVWDDIIKTSLQLVKDTLWKPGCRTLSDDEDDDPKVSNDNEDDELNDLMILVTFVRVPLALHTLTLLFPPIPVLTLLSNANGKVTDLEWTSSLASGTCLRQFVVHDLYCLTRDCSPENPSPPKHTPRMRTPSTCREDTMRQMALGAASGAGALLAWRRWGMRLSTAESSLPGFPPEDYTDPFNQAPSQAHAPLVANASPFY
ncbi:hypothetical protein EV363DRAFT_1299931 [Boletus edulis]|nr:hypothetical protein EV363DRAFT_1299931 [Boletus edulis]